MGDAMYRDLLERHAVLRLLLAMVTLITALYAGQMVWAMLLHFGGIILLFFLAWIVCFILQPLSAFLERRGLSRLVAVTAIYLSLLGVACGSIVLAIPLIQRQVGRVAAEVAITLTPDNMTLLNARAVLALRGLGLSAKDAQALVGQMSTRIPQWTGALTGQAVDWTTSLAGAIVNLLFNAVLVSMLSFYMMLDGDRLMASFVQRLPPAWHPDVRLLQRKIETSFGGYLRAQLIVALVYSVLTGISLFVLGQRNGLLFAVLAGLLMLLPFIGPFIAVVPPMMLVMLQSPNDLVVRNLIILLVCLVIAQQITMKLIAPSVMSVHVGLHPLLLFAALLVGAQEGGVWGAVFAAPIAAVIVAMLDVFFVRFQQSSHLYPEIVADPAGPPDAKLALPQAEPAREPVGTRAR
jgi:predicted PurR-regulated permease PerM